MNLDKLDNNEIMKAYPNYMDYLSLLYFSRKEKWAMYVRLEQEWPLHNTHTNNYVEASFRVLKTIIFSRTKAYNLTDLCRILIKENSNYYRDKCIAVGNNRYEDIHVRQSRYKASEVKLTAEQVVEVDKDLGIYLVESNSEEGKLYFVDQKSGYCQCEKGKLNGPCSHKHAIQHFFGVAEFSSIPEFDEAARARFHWIGTGKIFNHIRCIYLLSIFF